MKVNLTNKDGIIYAEIEREIYIATKSYYKTKKYKNVKDKVESSY